MLNIRNIAVIAHVDHGKTTLIDAFIKQSHIFRDNQDEMSQTTLLDSNVLERERGITILAKNISVNYKGTKINIIDTPGHSDFSGEVERTLGMADGALLIVDAQEGPMPQTRFVLKKAFELDLKVIVVINKIDKPNADISKTESRISNLFLELATEDHHIDYPILYAVSKSGKVFDTLPENFEAPGNVIPLLDKILEFIPNPTNDQKGSFKMLISSLNHDSHLGRIIVGKIFRGSIKPGQKVLLLGETPKSHQINKVFTSEGLGRLAVEEAYAGDIVSLTGITNCKIGQTISTLGDTEPLASAIITEPTLHITVGPNTSPLSGREGEFTTARQIEERLAKELEINLSLKLEKLESGKYKVSGKGELHLAVLLETLRREGYEVEVGKPEVIYKIIDGQKCEPYEDVNIVAPQEYLGTITQEVGKRLGVLSHMDPVSDKEVEFVYKMPTRAILGLRSLLLTATKGTVIFNSQFLDFEPVGENLPKMRRGVLIATNSGEALSYGLQAAQERGSTFVEPADAIYEGQIVGANAKAEDIEINACKGKQLTNMRSKSSDGVIQLVPAIKFSLEQCLDFLESDELLEITPKNLRLRKKYLTQVERRRHRDEIKNTY
ncbi:MAG: GTP-binding protein TypA [Candidatus Collierbacteria bacterium GW2011_GWB1_45_35]|uniref:GTP-binding protein TypA n=1 Tax=Candidatus Collierbacteria bacterium GW2011_GWB2_45_17 TaxID=1618388 RepID=A0A837IGU4_9BACT|nr:MAG: GTP-binding protein TypA [Microgenomates group bacterium GW2011_GWC1_44_23]KKT95732.1 MAG: GTP-binding protein TypA [Candidatus Collierbacteria bacterium GW2011_GWA1_45_15]KKU00379.1 MAG: GTP-binding protein TypA [Candidatus Collierbacteria bacterium GW2011_GWB2_45_17]KKU05830.1 MAG: GTP-binding protein TypA [Candidatus Collierbacteria bacterium GW2011_GWB1_45_35]KKU07448.1 MAG: GTP-binding protein TypA [Candidatus Collierbacteria bacterium GW2011_GWC2_45_40]HBC44741.1 translational GT